MCFNCWEEMGRPAALTPDTMKAVAAVKRLYEANCVGGHAHIVTDDWNLEDDDVAWCRTDAARSCHPPETAAAADAVLDLFAAMDVKQRATVLAIEAGFLPTVS